MSKNVAVFVDVANIFYAAKAAGVDIDYVTLLKAASAGRDLVRAYAYTGLDPENENQRQFHSFLARNGYKVVSKDIRKYGDGKVKANLDIELVVDMMKTARNLDIAVVVSGDGDFAPAIRAVQETGVRCEVISFRGNTSSDLIEVADVFTDITQIAKVERGSSRSGRRVAAQEDLSMTEVPDKETEGASRRGRGRGRARPAEAEERAPRPAPAERAPRREAPAVAFAAPVPSGAPIVVLPGEKLRRAAPVTAAEGAAPAEVAAPVEGAAQAAEDAMADLELEEGVAGPMAPIEGPTEEQPEAGRRRRRRRGGRGRGRGRGTETQVEVVAGEPGEEEEEFVVEAPRVPQHSAFGSVWDSQLGMAATPLASSAGPIDEEDEEEPEIPEYLLAERRQRGGAPRGGRGPSRGGGRGGRAAAYQQAVERERYGRGTPSQMPMAPRRDRGPVQGGRPDRRPPRPMAAESRQSSGSEPWSEVPPELEEMLRAELARKGAPPSGQRPARPQAGRPGGSRPQPARPESSRQPAAATPTEAATAAEAGQTAQAAATPAATPVAAPSSRGRGRRPAVPSGPAEAEPVAAQGPSAEPSASAKAPRTRAQRSPAAESKATDGTATAVTRRSPRKAASAAGQEGTAAPPPEAPAQPKTKSPSGSTAAPARRGGRQTGKSAEGGAGAGDSAGQTAPTTKPRSRSKPAAPEA